MNDFLEKFREWLLDKDYPMDIIEVLGCIIGLFENDKDVEKIINSYIDDVDEMITCTQKFYKVKNLVDEQFYSGSEE